MAGFRFTIGKKIGSGFGVLLFLTVLVFGLTYSTLNESRKINDQITKIYNPSIEALEHFNFLMVKSRMLIINWVYTPSGGAPEKDELKVLMSRDFPEQRDQINELAVNWSISEQEQIKNIFTKCDELFIFHSDIIDQLGNFESYSNPMVEFLIHPMVFGGQVEDINSEIIHMLEVLIADQQKNTDNVSNEMLGSFDQLEFVVRTLGIALVLGGLLIAVFTVRSIVKPVQELKGSLNLLGRGIIPRNKGRIENDEIGDMSLAMNDLVDGFQRTTDFAREVGSGNFESDYQPLSKDDSLGYALLKMREDLYETEKALEKKVQERTEEVVMQKEEIEYKNKEITASIRYAKRIQESILPDQSLVNRVLKDHFILYKPKDIVSGDFYCIFEQNGKALFAAADCTGHGVPGAFMSIIGTSLLKEAIVEHGKSEPASILNELNRLAGETINQTFEESTVKDGMDIAFCSLDLNSMVLEYAGAYNSLYVITSNNGDATHEDILKDFDCINKVEFKETRSQTQLVEVKANKFPIGVFVGEELKLFSNNKIKVKKGDTIYIFSDGYMDQFGGEKGRKFMAKRFREVILKCQNLSMSKQRDYLDKIIEDWRIIAPGSNEKYEQIDDILIIGVRV